MVESVFGSLTEAQKKQAEKDSEAESSRNKYYDTEFLKFCLGLTDLLHVLNASTNLTSALTSKIRLQNDLDNQRVTLSRLLINEEFWDIQPCVALLNSKKHFERNGLKPADKNISVEKFCDSQKKVVKETSEKSGFQG